MFADLGYIALALVLLFVGAEGLVRGSASLSLRAGLSPLMVGLTIVAFGTSSPELLVSVRSALSHQDDIAIGNVVGSNSFNIAVILGLTALLCPIAVHRQIIRIDAPIALGAALVLVLLLLDGELGRFEGVMLFSGILAYTWMNFLLARKQREIQVAKPNDAAAPKLSRHWGGDLGLIAGGLGGIGVWLTPAGGALGLLGQ